MFNLSANHGSIDPHGVKQLHCPPQAPQHSGRVHVVRGGIAQEAQALHPTDTEAREWATDLT
ncbi:hypothetical protein NRF20_43940 [Streptomyces sp. R-74717]|uniref:hypothetical protein n=1 Tax=Streptomyces TaxID=1883 RepID=UPI0037AF0C8B